MDPKLQFPPVRKKLRTGCLGCLITIVTSFAMGSLVVCLLWAVFSPWAFYLGGSFHMLPTWQGWGRMHYVNGGDYLLFVRIYPGRGSRVTGYPGLAGYAMLCTPRNERYRMSLGGSILNKHVGADLEDQPIHLYMHYRPWNYQFTTERRPRLEFYGKFLGPNLVVDDHGSLGRAFLPDGRVDRGIRKNLPWTQPVVPLTLAPGSSSVFNAACRATADSSTTP